MALTAYEIVTLRLLDDPTNAVYSTQEVDTAINAGRGQIAAATHCVRYTGAVSTTVGGAVYPLAGLSVETGVQGALTAQIGFISGAQFAYRPWEWFVAYRTLAHGAPNMWSIQEPGPLGSISVDPVPDNIYPLSFDLIGRPVILVDDTTPEAIPYPWTEAVPYFAAYLLYQDKQRTADALALLQRWGEFMSWGTRAVVSTVLPLYSPGGGASREAASKIVNTGFGPSAGGR
jgi:hypothetical protein